MDLRVNSIINVRVVRIHYEIFEMWNASGDPCVWGVLGLSLMSFRLSVLIVRRKRFLLRLGVVEGYLHGF